jgi:hypothetical protein
MGLKHFPIHRVISKNLNEPIRDSKRRQRTKPFWQKNQKKKGE